MIESARQQAPYEIEDASVGRTRYAERRLFHASHFEDRSSDAVRGTRRHAHEFLDESRHVFVVAIVGRRLALVLALFRIEHFLKRERVDESGSYESCVNAPRLKFVPE